MGSRDECARVLRILSTAYEAGGNLVEALACLRKAGDIEQRLKSEDAERRARALAARRRLDQASLETERYKQLALEDSLTGLANRRTQRRTTRSLAQRRKVERCSQFASG